MSARSFLIPGHSRAIGDEGNAYIDDFEGSQSTIDIRSVSRWFLASTPKLQESLFPEGSIEASPVYNYNRAGMSWYTIDPAFYTGSGLEDGQVSNEVRHDHRMRQILEQRSSNRDYQPGTPRNIPTFDMTFWPNERGPYNYLPADEPGIASGFTEEGYLEDPGTRWGEFSERRLLRISSRRILSTYSLVMDPFNEDSENTTVVIC